MTMQLLSIASPIPVPVVPTDVTPIPPGTAPVPTDAMPLAPMSHSTAATTLSASAHQPSTGVPAPDDKATNVNGVELKAFSYQTHSNQNLQWFTAVAKFNVVTTYPVKRGFKLFGYSSDESLALRKFLRDTGYSTSSHITKAVGDYLDNKNNKGKRLYDI